MSPPRAGGFGASLPLGLALAAFAACFSPELDGTHMCGPGGLCPDGYTCAPDNFCRRKGGGGADASAPGVNSAPGGDGDKPTLDGGKPTIDGGHDRTDGGDTRPDAGGGGIDGGIRLGCSDGVRDPGDICLDSMAAYLDVGAGAIDIVVGDFDGDPPVNIATANSASNTVTLLLNDGDVIMTKDISAGTAPISLAVADLDDEGHDDLVIANLDGVTVLLNPGISSGDSYELTFGAVLSVAVGEFSGDGLPDVAASTVGGPIEILYNEGGVLGFGDELGPTDDIDDLAVVDLQEDGLGDDDIVGVSSLAGTVYVYYQDPGSWSSLLTTVGGAPTWVAIARLDGDGRPDIVATDPEGERVMLFRNEAMGPTFTSIPTTGVPSGVAVGDFDGDGFDEVGTALPDLATVAIWRGLGDAAFDSPIYPVVGDGPTALVFADFSDDGVPDLAVANALASQVSITISDP